MKKFYPLLAVTALLCSSLMGQEGKEKELKVEWRPLKIAKSHFPRSVAVMDNEREDFADNLAGLAIVHLRNGKADKASRDFAKRMMSMALHLSPRNKKAVVLNAQLAKGLVPQSPQLDRQAKALSLLFRTRAQILEKEKGEHNIELAGYLYSLAADLDPKNEDAIYLSELFRINHGEVDWTKLLLSRE